MSVHSTHYDNDEEYERDLKFEYRREQWEKEHQDDMGDYPDTIHNQFDNMTGSMNL